MTKRQANKVAYHAAATALEALGQDDSATLYAGLSPADRCKVQLAILREAYNLGRRYAMMVHADVRRARR